MVEIGLIIICCYLIGVMAVHVVYRCISQNLRRSVHHYVIVTRNHEKEAELIMRAITWHAWLKGIEVSISVIDEGSRDNTLSIIRRLDPDGLVRMERVGNWVETERVIWNMKKMAKVAAYRGEKGFGGPGPGYRRTSASSGIGRDSFTVINMNRQEDRMKLPLFRYT